MSAAIGIWALGAVDADVVLYRWEAERQLGFVSFEVSMLRFRAADSSGRTLGDLLFDAITEEISGGADGVDRRLFEHVTGSILRMYKRAGAAPATAHVYYF
nr:hypothetical protein [uncultured Actinoplanes sp.]